MKFHTHHFPVGTIFVLNDEMYHYSTSKVPGEEFVATRVVRNGPNSYVVETTKKMNPEAFSDMNQSYNMSHVKAIIKRGDGPMVFEEREFNPMDFKFLEEKHILENYYNIKTKKTHFVHWSPRDIVMFCIRDRNTNGGGIFDMEKCLAALDKQSFATSFDHSKYGIGAVSLDKKRLKRFLKQNYNRFLVSVKEAQKQQDEIDNKLYSVDYFGSSFGLDEDPIAAEGLDQDKLFPNRQEGSSYSDGSDYSPFDNDGSSFGEELDGLSIGDEELNSLVDDPCFVPETGVTYRASEDDAVKMFQNAVADNIRNEAYRLFKEGGLAEQNLLTGQPTLDKMMEGGIPAGEPWPYSLPRFSLAEISVKHPKTGNEPLPAIPASELEYPWPTTYADSLLDKLIENKADKIEKKHEEDM